MELAHLDNVVNLYRLLHNLHTVDEGYVYVFQVLHRHVAHGVDVNEAVPLLHIGYAAAHAIIYAASVAVGRHIIFAIDVNGDEQARLLCLFAHQYGLAV